MPQKETAAVPTAANLINLDNIIPQIIPTSQAPTSKFEPTGSHIVPPPVLDVFTGITSHSLYPSDVSDAVIARAWDLWDCAGSETLTLFCEKNGHPRVVQLACSSRVCITCRPRLQRKLLARWTPLLRQLDPSRLVLLTLTRKIVPGCDLRARIKATRIAFGKLLRQKGFASCLQGGLYCFEVKLTNQKTWNIHIHCLAELTAGSRRRSWRGKSARHERCDILGPNGQKLSVQLLSAAWKKLTKDSFVVDIAPIAHGSTHQTFNYLSKYLTKAPQGLCPDRTPLELIAYHQALVGLRQVQSFGSWHHTHKNFRFILMPPEKFSFPCAICGCREWVSEYTLRRISWQNLQKRQYAQVLH